MNPYLLSFICLGLIFASTVIGASFTLFFKKSLGPNISYIVVGFSGVVMVSSAVFGLLLPSMEQASASFGNYSLLVVCGSFLAGCLLLFGLDKLIPHMHPDGRKEGPETSGLKPSTKLFLAVTLHNIPEGIAVGLACGIYFASPDQWPIALAAIALALGISIQNIPEGAAVSLPLLDEGYSRGKAFAFGAISGLPEPLFGIVACAIGAAFSSALPFLLSFAAGAMIYATVDELIPGSISKHEHFGLWSFIIGFVVMMALEIALG